MSIRPNAPALLNVRVLLAAIIVVALFALSGCGAVQSQPVTAQSITPRLPLPPSSPSAPGTSPTQTVGVQRSFGIHIHDPLHHWPSVPFGFWRVWDCTVDWPRVEPVKGYYDFSRMDQYVKLAEQHKVDLIYVLGNTPTWAAVNPTSPSNEGLPGASSALLDVQDWQDYVRTIVTRYKGHIQAYEVWNEANLSGYWTGSVDQMLQMAQIAFTTIKQIDPSATVLAPSVVGSTGVSWSSKFLAAGGANYTDAIAFHLYNTSQSPESIVKYYQGAMALGQQWSKPVWDTEVGYGPWGTFNDVQSASYLARLLILQSAAGLMQIGWYAWDDRGGWVHLYLVQPDMQTPTLAGIAFGEIQSWLADSAITCSNISDTWQCDLAASDGKHKYIVWNPASAATFSVPSAWNVSRFRDLQGGVQGISGNQVQIDSMPVLLEP